MAKQCSIKEYNWTNVGRKYVGDDAPTRDNPKWTRAQILEAIESITWYDMPTDGSSVSLPMMPGENIKELIKQLKVPKVSQIGHGSELAPYGLLAVVGNYKNGRATIYALDAGNVSTILLSVFEPKEG